MFFIMRWKEGLLLKVIDKPIQMLALFKDGVIDPMQFWIEAKDESIHTIKIDTIISREKFRGKNTIMIRCKCIINGIQRTLDIEYWLETCKWVLHSIE